MLAVLVFRGIHNFSVPAEMTLPEDTISKNTLRLVAQVPVPSILALYKPQEEIIRL